MRLVSLAFQLFVYKGSHVPSPQYTPLVHSLSQRFSDLNVTVQEGDYSFFKRKTFDDDTILVGHSFGGYFSLLDARCNDKVKGVVLLNSHCNSKGSAWYPGVKQETLDIPLFTLVGGRDNRLPLQTVLPDLWQKKEDQLNNVFYKVYPDFHHFSGLSTEATNETEMIANDIELFVRSVVYKKDQATFQKYCQDSEDTFGYGDIHKQIPNSINLDTTQNMLDGLFQIVLKRFFWTWLHNILFLFSSPNTQKSFVFTDFGDHILIKSCNTPIEDIVHLCQASISKEIPTECYIIDLPSNVFGLYYWLLFPLHLQTQIEHDGIIRWPIVKLHVRENINYYKILHPRQVILKYARTLLSSPNKK